MLLASCAAANTLSRAQAISLADIEARKHVGDLHRYVRAPVFHEDGRWYVGYRQPGKKWVDFGVDVYDKTKKAAWVIMQ